MALSIRPASTNVCRRQNVSHQRQGIWRSWRPKSWIQRCRGRTLAMLPRSRPRALPCWPPCSFKVGCGLFSPLGFCWALPGRLLQWIWPTSLGASWPTSFFLADLASGSGRPRWRLRPASPVDLADLAGRFLAVLVVALAVLAGCFLAVLILPGRPRQWIGPTPLGASWPTSPVGLADLAGCFLADLVLPGRLRQWIWPTSPSSCWPTPPARTSTSRSSSERGQLRQWILPTSLSSCWPTSRLR